MLEMTAGGFRIPLTPRLSTPATPDDPAEIRGAALCRPAGGASSDSPDQCSAIHHALLSNYGRFRFVMGKLTRGTATDVRPSPPRIV
jgi:hypothetical protein